MNLEEYKQKLEAHLLTFKDLDVEVRKNILSEIKNTYPELLTEDVARIVVSGFSWANSLQGLDYWECVHTKLIDAPPKPTVLNKSDIQYLLSELRDTLSVVTELKTVFKREAEDLWEFCDKDDPSTQQVFEAFSRAKAYYTSHKKQESKLASLIKKVKVLQ
jgi:hypothetical protein